MSGPARRPPRGGPSRHPTGAGRKSREGAPRRGREAGRRSRSASRACRRSGAKCSAGPKSVIESNVAPGVWRPSSQIPPRPRVAAESPSRFLKDGRTGRPARQSRHHAVRVFRRPGPRAAPGGTARDRGPAPCPAGKGGNLVNRRGGGRDRRHERESRGGDRLHPRREQRQPPELPDRRAERHEEPGQGSFRADGPDSVVVGNESDSIRGAGFETDGTTGGSGPGTPPGPTATTAST